MDGPTQDQMDDVENDEDAPRPSAKRSGKQAAKLSKKKAQVQESEGEGGADEEQESDSRYQSRRHPRRGCRGEDLR